ncbi:hypothetical protein OG394_14860 [Kribbella sp. NBC_01245]|uniref:aa3-type cytochrome oxidase subunit CtaJ n=1 Tax=Kribbella sp. NBC_01245 TaxID=2903578 RepID=UPI002E283C61|nr:hypothetical protein [Kribbella sp. NBC_01245]
MIAQLSGHTVAVFVGIPALIVAVVALLVYASSIAKGPRYRPGLSWWAPPVWIGGPGDRTTTTAPELTAGEAAAKTVVVQSPGGASASW